MLAAGVPDRIVFFGVIGTVIAEGVRGETCRRVVIHGNAGIGDPEDHVIFNIDGSGLIVEEDAVASRDVMNQIVENFVVDARSVLVADIEIDSSGSGRNALHDVPNVIVLHEKIVAVAIVSATTEQADRQARAVPIGDVIMQKADVVTVGLRDALATGEDPRVTLDDIVLNGDVLNHMIPSIAHSRMRADADSAGADVVERGIDDLEIHRNPVNVSRARCKPKP